MKTPDRYENHEAEWREEENKNRYEREQAKKNRWIDPRDPDYIAPEEDEKENSEMECEMCGKTGPKVGGRIFGNVDDINVAEVVLCDDCYHETKDDEEQMEREQLEYW